MLIRYITRTYQDVFNDLTNDPLLASVPFFIRNAFASVFAALSTMINVLVNQFFISTVQAQDIGSELFKLNDYTLKGNRTSRVFVVITINPSVTVSSSYTIAQNNLVFLTEPNADNVQYQFEARQSLTIAQGQASGTVEVFQQKTTSNAFIGTTDGTSAQTFDLPDKNILSETITINIATDQYLPVDTFAYSNDPTLLVFKPIVRSDATTYVIMPFIDPITLVQYGKIPVANQTITANFAVGGGEASNVNSNTITVYAGSDPNVLTVNNPQAATGGANPELLDQAKTLVPLLSRTHNMFWDASSGRAIALSVNGVLQAQVASTGILMASCYIIPNGGGYPSITLKNDVKNALIAKSSFEQVTISVNDPIYIPLTVGGTYEIYPNVIATDVYRFLIFCAAYRTFELSFYLYQSYKSNGMEATISLINTLLFPLTNYNYDYGIDGVKLQRIMDNVPYLNMGETVRPNDITSACMSFVDGIKYVTLTSFTSAPIVPFGGVIQPSSVSFTLI